MCQKCEQSATQAPTQDLRERLRVGSGVNVEEVMRRNKELKLQLDTQARAKHREDEKTIGFVGNDQFNIKPFATLDDVVVTGEKLVPLLFPDEQEGRQIELYEADLIRKASAVVAAAPNVKFEALTDLLATVLIGFEADELGDIKAVLASQLQKRASAVVRANTTTFLESKGFGRV